MFRQIDWVDNVWPRHLKQDQEDVNSRLVKHLLSLPENIKKSIGHKLKKTWSMIEDQDRLGFIINCNFKGLNCSDER